MQKKEGKKRDGMENIHLTLYLNKVTLDDPPTSIKSIPRQYPTHVTLSTTLRRTPHATQAETQPDPILQKCHSTPSCLEMSTRDGRFDGRRLNGLG